MLLMLIHLGCSLLLVQARKRISWDQLFGNPDLFEGDIIVDDISQDLEVPVYRQVMVEADRLWPNGVVHYYIEEDVAKKRDLRVLKAAMKTIEDNTCIRFERIFKRTLKNHVRIYDKGTCSSSVGVNSKPLRQRMSLGKDCWHTYVILHELMHTLGFHHEHSRFDRDEYINIHYENIRQEKWRQFKIRKAYKADVKTPYDYNSIMHYPPDAFAINNETPTITAKRKGVKVGPGTTLSKLDIEKINLIYNCKTKSPGAKLIAGPLLYLLVFLLLPYINSQPIRFFLRMLSSQATGIPNGHTSAQAQNGGNVRNESPVPLWHH